MLTQVPDSRSTSGSPVATAAMSSARGISSCPTWTRTDRENQSGRSSSSLTLVVMTGAASASR